MWKFIGVLSLMGVPAFVIMAMVSFFRKTDKTKKFFKIASVCFALFILAVAMNPTPQDNKATVNQSKTEQTAQQTTDQKSTTSNQLSSAASASNQTSPIKLLSAKVIRVIDGDTAVVNINGKEEKVRFIGVDTPETKHPSQPVEAYGPESSQFTTSQLAGKQVYLETDVTKRDNYDRLLAYVWKSPPKSTSDSEIRSKMFNATLLLSGYAQLMTISPNVKYVDYFTTYQKEARVASRGLWGIEITEAEPESTPSQTVSTEAFVGSSKSDKYHYPYCQWAKKINPANLVEFNSSEEARKAGYVPCKVCSPP